MKVLTTLSQPVNEAVGAVTTWDLSSSPILHPSSALAIGAPHDSAVKSYCRSHQHHSVPNKRVCDNFQPCRCGIRADQYECDI